MSADLFWFSDEQWSKIEPHLPKNQRGPERHDDRRILSGIMHVQKVGLWGQSLHAAGLKRAARSTFSPSVGVWTYVATGVYRSTSASNLLATLSLGLAILTLLLGASANRIAEKKWVNAVKRNAATEKGSEVAAVLARVEKTNVTTTIVVGLALVSLILSRIVI